jgi:hypothetical protein
LHSHVAGQASLAGAIEGNEPCAGLEKATGKKTSREGKGFLTSSEAHWISPVGCDSGKEFIRSDPFT